MGFIYVLSLTTMAAPLPQSIPGINTINAEQLIDLATQQTDLNIIDARITGDRGMGYISGSHSLPDITTNCDSLASIASMLNEPVAFYCNGIKCGRSLVSAKIAVTCGYTDIYWFRGGFSEWQDKRYPVEKE